MISYDICLSVLLHLAWYLPSMLLQRSFSLFLMVEQYSIAYMYHIFFIHSSIHGHLGCFHVLDTDIHIMFQILSVMNKLNYLDLMVHCLTPVELHIHVMQVAVQLLLPWNAIVFSKQHLISSPYSFFFFLVFYFLNFKIFNSSKEHQCSGDLSGPSGKPVAFFNSTTPICNRTV